MIRAQDSYRCQINDGYSKAREPGLDEQSGVAERNSWLLSRKAAAEGIDYA